MKKSKTTNRNLWSTTEDKVLVELVKTSKNISQAMGFASTQLGRTKGACYQRYDKISKRSETNTERRTNPRRFEFNIKSYSIKNGKLIVTI